ncbi:MAG: helix-turn-helix domain-containing protein [Leptonema sp. (in: bacteria)]
MSLLDVGILLRIFYKYPLNYIPLLDNNQAGEFYIVGFLSRNKVLQFSTDKARLEEKFPKIPEHFIEKIIQPRTISEFFKKAPIPVYNTLGKFIENWEERQINDYLKIFLNSTFYSETNQKENENLSTSIDLQKFNIIETVLSAIPLPLFALNRNGVSIFYNDFFIKEILEKGPFKNTMGLAEAFFKEAIERGIAENIKKNLDFDHLFLYIKEIRKKILISNIQSENEVLGYLIIFFDDSLIESGETTNQKRDIVSFVEKHLNENKTYEEILEIIEVEVIQEFLKKNHYNISRTAELLKVNRTTLQNKIKRLDILNQSPISKHKQDMGTEKTSKKSKTSKKKGNNS